MATISFTPEKKKKVQSLFKSFRAIELQIEPYLEQRKDLRKEYLENQWLDNNEFSLARKAYNVAKRKMDFDDFSSFMEVANELFGTDS